LLEKVATDTKSGAGQYFTPRPLIKAMVECIKPRPGETIADPACGTGGFFLAAFDYITESGNYRLDKGKKEALKRTTFKGYELVPNTARLCAMNLMLHGIGGEKMPIKCYNPENRTKRKETDRFKFFKYDELIARDKANLDITWLKDDSIEDVDSLPAPEVIAKQMMENLSVVMEKMENVYGTLKKKDK
jgi:type I restriction-modification system DNA methylase subunit